MELPILVEMQPFILAYEMGENQGKNIGAMGKSPIFAQLLGKMMSSTIFYAPIVSKNCGQTLANKMASCKNLNFTTDQVRNTYFRHLHMKTMF